MIYRLAKTEDLEQIIKLCDDNNIEFPYNSTLTVAENSEGKIVAILGVKTELYFEPCISLNSMAAIKLYKISESLLENKANYIRCICNDKMKLILSKLGFIVVEPNKFIMEKEF